MVRTVGGIPRVRGVRIIVLDPEVMEVTPEVMGAMVPLAIGTKGLANDT